MIIPMVCFTCGKPIAHLYDRYLDLVKQYSLEERQEEVKKQEEQEEEQPEKKEARVPTFKALADLHIGRECCRRMFLCQHDMYTKVR